MARADDIIILDGCTFWYSDANGDLEAKEHEGFFYQDVRHISKWQLRVDGCELDPLTSRRVDYFSARIVGKPDDESDEAPPITVRRDRFVTEGAHEDVVLENLTGEPHDVRLELAYASDFADVMEAQEGGIVKGKQWQDVTARSVTLWNERDGYRRGTVVKFNRSGRITRERATFRVQLAPRSVWSLCIDVVPVVDGRRRPPLLRCNAFHDHANKMPMSLDEWLNDTPELETGPRLTRAHLPAERPRSRGAAGSARRRVDPLGDARRRHSVVPDHVRARQSDHGLSDDPVPPGTGAGDTRGARRDAGHRMGRLPRRGAREDHARAPPGNAREDRQGPAHALLRHARRDDAVADPAGRVRAVERRHEVRAENGEACTGRSRLARRARRPRRGRIRRVPQALGVRQGARQPLLEGLRQLDPLRGWPQGRAADRNL